LLEKVIKSIYQLKHNNQISELEDKSIIIIGNRAGFYYIKEDRETIIFWTAYILALIIILVIIIPLP
jgi:hypothetical protein